MEAKKLLNYCQPLVNVVTVQACCIVCNSETNRIANVGEDDYGTY
jgi:hypothetical protein